MSNKVQLPLGLLLAYGSLAFPLAAAFIALQVIIPTFYAQATPLSLTAIGAILLLARLCDTVTDPIVGYWSDHSNTRFGRRKAFVVLASPLIALSIVFLFNPPTDADAFYLLFWTIMIYVAGTLSIVPMNAWAAELHADHFDWAGNQVVDLYMNNRGFMERQHAHTVLLNAPEYAYRDDDPVPIELAFDHHYAGLAVVAVDPADGVSDAELGAHLDEIALPALLADSPIASMVSWRYIAMGEGTEQAPMDLGMPPGPPERRLQMFFLEASPETCWDRFHAYADALAESGKGTVSFAAPFLPTIVGTDTYTDQLW